MNELSLKVIDSIKHCCYYQKSFQELLNSKTPAIHIFIWGAYNFWSTSATTEKITTNWLLLQAQVQVVNWVIFLIESGINTAWCYYWVEYLHLILSPVRETYDTSTESTAMTNWNCLKQTVLIYIKTYSSESHGQVSNTARRNNKWCNHYIWGFYRYERCTKLAGQ